MGHNFKPVTPTEEIQVAILDELQQIKQLLEPSRSEPELPAEPESKADAPADDKPAANKPPAKKTAATRARKTVTGR